MVLRKEITLQIKDLLKENPQGLSITDIVNVVDINRNTAGRYLENLLVSGQVEMRRLGMAKIYMLSQRVPLSAVLSISSELVIQLDSSLRIIFANEPFLKLVGTDSKNLLGKNIEYTPVALVFDDLFPEFLENIREGLTGKEFAGDIVLTTKDLIFFCRIAPTVFDDGRKGVTVLLEDITGEKRAELTLQESEDRYRKLVEISPDAVFLHREGKIIYANPAAFKLLGASHSDEIIGKKILDFIHPDFRDAVRKNIEKDLRGNITPPIELHMLRIDGASIIVEGRGVGTSIDGKPAVQVAIRDITERKRIEEILKKSEKQYRSLVETTGTGYVILDKEGRVITANQEYVRLTGKSTLAEIEKRPVTDWTASYDIERNIQEIDDCFRKGWVRDFEVDYQKPDGTIQPIEVNASVIQSDSEQIILTLCRDITERKRAEKVLRESEEKYRNLINRANDGIIVLQDSIIKMCNRYVAEFWGGSIEEVMGKPFTDFIHPDTLSEVIDRYYQRMAGENPPSIYQTILKRKDGSRFFAELNAGIISYEGKPANLIIIRDINERKKVEAALSESEEKYRTLINRANDVISIVQDGIIKMCNPRLAEFWGGSIEEVLGKPFTDFVHPDALREVIDRYNRRMAGESPPSLYETIFLRKDGSKSYVELNASIISYEGKKADLVIVRDINDRKKITDALRDSEERLRLLLDSTEDLVFMQDTEGRYLYFNATARYGVSGEKILGSTPHDLLDKEVADRMVERVRTVAKTGQSIRKETPLVWKGQTLWFSDRLSPVRDANGTIKAVVTISQNITEHKRAEAALRESEEKYRTLVTATGDIVWETDAQAHFVYVSPQVESIIGYKPDELIGHAPFEFLKTDAIEPNQKMFRSAIEKREKSIIYISHWIHKDGHGVYLESHAVPIYRSDGSFSGFIGIDRKKTL